MHPLVALLLLSPFVACAQTTAPGTACASQELKHSTSLLIPCIPRDVEVLARLVESLRNQTLQPCEIVVALSQTTPETAAALETRLRLNFAEVKVVATTAHQAPGQNRNRAAAAARGKLLSFIDADDSMHHQRLEILNDVFEALGDGAPPGWGGQDPTPACVLHSFTTSQNTSFHDDFDAAQVSQHTSWCSRVCWADMATLANDAALIYHGEPVWSLPHNGHVTCHRHVLNRVQYDAQHVKEDFAFVQNVRDALGENSLAFCSLPLTAYMPSAERSHPETLAGRTYLDALERLQG